MAANPKSYFTTPEAYLAHERTVSTKSEYFDGQVIAMAGVSFNHSYIVGNLGGELRTRLRGSDCRSHTSDMRVSVPGSHYFYPDVVVFCGTPQITPDYLDNLANPVLIVEVLSPSTTDYDRSARLVEYRRIPTLREYILVSQTEPLIERYTRQGEDIWVITLIRGLDAVLEMTSINVSISLREIYLYVDFDKEESD